MEGAMVALRAIYRDTRSEYMGPMELPSGGIHGITLRLESAPSGAIGGYAVDGFGEPAKALIMLDRIDAPHRGSSGGQCEVDGFFLESNLESGSYGLRVVPSDDYERIIELAEGQRITDLRVVVSGVLKITGRVTDAEGRPVDGADVSAMVPGAELDSGSTFTDGDGRFVLEVLEEGKYSILVYVRGLDGASWQGTATTGDYIEIEMAPPSDQETDPEQ
jgi:hypothetical protein